MNATVIICTYDRPAVLQRTLKSIQELQESPFEWETIIVDNSPSKSASDVVDQFREKIPRLTYTWESQTGLSYARNQGVRIAQGDWVIFLDDDAQPEPDWLNQFLPCLFSLPDPGCVGGRVLLQWSMPPPEWLIPKLYPYLSYCDFQTNGIPAVLNYPNQYPVGANIAYPRKVFDQLGGFDPRFGRQADLLLSGEETDFNFRLIRAGYKIWFCPNATVQHLIPPERMTLKFFRDRSFWNGRTWALLDDDHDSWDLYPWKKPAHLRYYLSRGLASALFSGFRHRSPLIFQLFLLEVAGYFSNGRKVSSE